MRCRVLGHRRALLWRNFGSSGVMCSRCLKKLELKGY